LIATVKADAPAGPFKQQVVLKTNDPAHPMFTFDVSGTVQAGLSLVPQNVSFKGIKLGETQSKKVSVRATRPFQILKVEGQTDGVTVDLPKGKDVLQILTVNFRPTKTGELRRQLTIRTDLDDSPTVLAIEASVQK
jgi:hypothetical protein